MAGRGPRIPPPFTLCTFYQGELTLTNWRLNQTFWYKTIFNWLVGILGRVLVTSYCQTAQKIRWRNIWLYEGDLLLLNIHWTWWNRETRELDLLAECDGERENEDVWASAIISHTFHSDTKKVHRVHLAFFSSINCLPLIRVHWLGQVYLG